MALGWQEPADSPDDLHARMMRLDLAGVEPGRYTLEVQVSHPASGSVTARRNIEITPAPDGSP